MRLDCVIPPTYRRSGLVENEEFAPAHNCTRQSKYLALTDREVGTSARNLRVECDARFVILILQVEEAGGTQSVVQYSIVVFPEGIEVLTECSAE